MANPSPIGGFLLLSALFFATACTPKRTTEEKRPDPPAPAEAAPHRAPVKLSVFADTQIEAGSSHTGYQIASYRILRSEGDTGKTLLEAAALCNKGGRTLCTESQWIRACDVHPAIGAMPSWTASWKDAKTTVRGGGACDQRERVDAFDRSESRVAFCCDRAVSMRAEGDAGDRLPGAAALLLRYESALNNGDLVVLRSLFADTLVRERRLLTVDALLERERESAKTDPLLWTLYDGCSVRPGLVVVDIDADAGTGRLRGTLIDCNTLVARASGVVSFRTTIGLSPSGDAGTDRIHELRHRGSPLAPGAR